MMVHARARAFAFVLPVAALAAISCSDKSGDEPAAGSTRARAEAARVPPRCTLNPWDSGGTRCGNLTLVHHRVTCEELGFVGAAPGGVQNITLVPGASDADGRRLASFDAEGGISTRASTFTSSSDGDVETYWQVASTVNADGSTMTFDALVVAGDLLTDSQVLRFDSPQFNVSNIPVVTPTTTIELCGYRPGKSLGVPPPVDPGAATVTCGFRAGDPGIPGSASAPGPTVTSMSDIRWSVMVTPPPLDPARIQMQYELDGAQWGTNFALASGTAAGGFFHPSLRGQHAALALRFSYGANSCTLHWTLDERASSSSSSSGAGGHAW